MNFTQTKSIDFGDYVISSYQTDGYEKSQLPVLINALCQRLDGVYKITASYPTGHDLRHPPDSFRNYEDYANNKDLIVFDELDAISVAGLKSKKNVIISIEFETGILIVNASISKQQIEEYCREVEANIAANIHAAESV